MFLLLRLALRNLFRQKRRNLLLGSAMAIGVMLLVLANSFSRGLSDIMINKVMRWVTGHVTVVFNERGRVMTEVFRDKSRLDFIHKDFGNLIIEEDEAIGVFVRAVGNGRSDNMIVIGVDVTTGMTAEARREMEESFKLIEGSWDDLKDPRYEQPLILTLDKAKSLNLKRFDTVRIRMRNLFGQDQSARATVVGFLKIENIFMQSVTFMDVDKLKNLLGYDEHSTGNINLVIRDPQKNARTLADAIHQRLSHPGLALIFGEVRSNGRPGLATVLGFNSDPALATSMATDLKLTAGTLAQVRLDKTSLVAAPLAQRSGLSLGSPLIVTYTDKWGRTGARLETRVGGIFEPGTDWGPNVVLVHDDRFYEAFYSRWPRTPGPDEGAFTPRPDHPGRAWLSPEWVLLPRTATTQDLQKKYKEMGKKKWRSTLIDVRTMYETAEQALQLEGVLNLITLSAVLVLFFIILIGVINTLRMTIRERTREIGTIRAVGMQQRDVRDLFIAETVLLAFFASVAGVLLALAVMGGLSQIPWRVDDNPLGMILVRGRLYFLPSWSSVIGNMVLIWVLAGVTAYFPARRAAKMPPGKALRHFE